MSLWQLRWYLSKNEEVNYNSWRERLHLPVWLFPSVERTPRAALLKRKPESSLTPIFFRTPRPKGTGLTTRTLAALAAGPITTIANPHWQATVPRVQHLTSPKLAHIPGAQETTYDPPRFPVLHHSPLCQKPSYGSFGSTTISNNRSPEKSLPIMTTYGGTGLGIQGIRINSSFEAATGIGMGSHYKVPWNRARSPTPNGRVHVLNCSSPKSPKGRVLTPESTFWEKEPTQIRQVQLATRKHRSSSITASEKPSQTVQLDGEGRRMEKRARMDERMQGVKRVDEDPFRTPELRVVNIDV